MDTDFKRIAAQLAIDADKQDTISKFIQELKILSQGIQTIISHLYNLSGNIEEMQRICESTRPLFLQLRHIWTLLIATIHPRPVTKYSEYWKFVTSSLVTSAALVHFILTRSLITIEYANSMLQLSNLDGSNEMEMDLEVYLFGVCGLTKELGRLAVNSVINLNYEYPYIIQSFAADLFSGFQLLNLRNDNLRKRYDAVKYDMQKIEDVIYDIAVRNLSYEQSKKKIKIDTNDTKQ